MTRILLAAERQVEVDSGGGGVDLDQAGLQARRRAPARRQGRRCRRRRPGRSATALARAMRRLQVRRPAGQRDRPEHLLAGQRRGPSGAPSTTVGATKYPARSERRPADHQAAATRNRGPRSGEHPAPGGLVDHRADGRVRVGRVAEAPAPRTAATSASANSAAPSRRPRSPAWWRCTSARRIRRSRRRSASAAVAMFGVGQHDRRVLAAHLGLHRDAARGRRRRPPTRPAADGAGERDHVGRVDQRLPGGARRREAP